MGCQVNIAEAKAKLPELLDRALGGEEIVIARAGKPLARLAPLRKKRPRKPGAWTRRRENSATSSGSACGGPTIRETAARYPHHSLVGNGR